MKAILVGKIQRPFLIHVFHVFSPIWLCWQKLARDLWWSSQEWLEIISKIWSWAPEWDRERTPVPIEYEAGWLQLVWIDRLEEIFFAFSRDRTSVVQSVVRHYTLTDDSKEHIASFFKLLSERAVMEAVSSSDISVN
jgi:hypothetical protein